MASPLRSSNSGSGTSVKLIPLGEKEVDSEVTDITAVHLQDLQRQGSLTTSQSHPDEDYRIDPINRRPVDTPTTTVVSLAHYDYQILFTPIQKEIQDLRGELESLTTTLIGWQVAAKVEEALYEYICQIVLPLDQQARMKSPSAALFFYSINRCERRRRRGLDVFPSDATNFHIWNTHLKTHWEGIVKAVKAGKGYWGTLRHPSAHPATGAGDYDTFVTWLQLPPAQQALLTRARTDMLSFMSE
ncbi:uncharacterized protein ARMOST_04776 [Armillaria ostoyae]|uniref:Uncharacterized protein n=1 Tax=Armillaria ostoyae TaxID=47428 RepID=A0A284QYB5_ARMOS|nr:uncharacterized protein ARMOST_04776 [Armillaria ostoyae]